MATAFTQQRSTVVPPVLWSLPEIAGRFVEISGSNATTALTITFGLVLDAQKHGDPVGWTTSTASSFYPPDVAELGIDLASLVVVRITKPDAIARAGEKLIRSGGFGLVVLDLGAAEIPMPLQTRLTGLAHHHHAALICITESKVGRFRLARWYHCEFTPSGKESGITSSLVACGCSRISGGDRRGRMNKCIMDRRACAD